MRTEIEEDDNFPEPYEEGFLSSGKWGYLADEHDHLAEVYVMRGGNLRLAHQIERLPLHFDQPVEEPAASPRMLTYVLGFAIIFWALIVIWLC